MKKLFLVMSLMMVLVVAPMAMADPYTISWTRVSGYYSGNGGEFTLTPSGNLQWVLNHYVDDVTKNIGTTNNTFQSFCIETQEYVYTGETYAAVLNDKAIYGQTSTGDPLSKGAAWLYYLFATRQLTGYDYDTTGGDRSLSAGALQNAIWFFEGEGGANNAYVNLAVTHFGALGEDASADNAGEIPVAVLNLWVQGHVGESGYQRQDQLVLVPEPATMLFMGVGLIGMAGFIRRRFKK